MNDDERPGAQCALATPSPTRFPIFGEMHWFDKENLMGLPVRGFGCFSPNWFAEFMQ
ncbi:MAG: hypothetical protein RIG26_11555 [Thalassospira sp.]|uniref:hypothetical protein n=1 Tax=Thalassospira sp. TaxID=1912094 RepID=UPI0032EEBA77